MINNNFNYEKTKNNNNNYFNNFNSNSYSDNEKINNNQRCFFLSPNQQNIEHHNIIFENYPIQTRLDLSNHNGFNSLSNQTSFNRLTENNCYNLINKDLVNNNLSSLNSLSTRQSHNKDINNISYIPNPTASFQPVNGSNKIYGDMIIPHNTRNN